MPIDNEEFPSNWELSAARAASIVKMMADGGLDPARLAAIGYGEFQPVTDNSSPERQAENRRVVLMISRNANLRPSLPRPEAPVGEASVETDAVSGEDVIRLELEGGGLLFTNDPARGGLRARDAETGTANRNEAP